MTTAIKKARNQKKLQTLATQINNSAGQLQIVRDGLTNDIRDLIKAANRGDARMMLRELSVAVAEIKGRAIQLSGHIADLENLRDKIVKSMPEKLKG